MFFVYLQKSFFNLFIEDCPKNIVMLIFSVSTSQSQRFRIQFGITFKLLLWTVPFFCKDKLLHCHKKSRPVKTSRLKYLTLKVISRNCSFRQSFYLHRNLQLFDFVIHRFLHYLFLNSLQKEFRLRLQSYCLLLQGQYKFRPEFL